MTRTLCWVFAEDPFVNAQQVPHDTTLVSDIFLFGRSCAVLSLSGDTVIFFVVKAINIIFPRIWNESVELDHIRSCVSFSPCVQIMCHIQPLRNGRLRGKYKQLPSTYLNPCRCQVIATRNSDTNLVIWRGPLVSFSLLFSTEIFSSSIGCSRNRFLFLVQIPLNLQF